MTHIVKLADMRVGGVYRFPVLANSMTLYNSIAEFVRIAEVTNMDSFAVFSVCPVVMKKSSELSTLGYTFTKYGVLTNKGVSGELFICDQQNITVECITFNAAPRTEQPEPFELANIPEFDTSTKQNGWSMDIRLEICYIHEGVELDLTMGALFPGIRPGMQGSVIVNPPDLAAALISPQFSGPTSAINKAMPYYHITVCPPGH